jgi:short-chain fatty acids transporter
MLFSDKIGKILKNSLPAPFTIAVILTFLTILIAFFISTDSYNSKNFFEILSFWEKGLWDNSLMVFALQMMLMLVLGHSLALSEPVSNIISNITIYCNNTANAAAIVTFTTLLVAFFNWGLGLIFGAIFARKVGEHATKNNIPLNYPLVGAAGYSGLMIWHGRNFWICTNKNSREKPFSFRKNWNYLTSRNYFFYNECDNINKLTFNFTATYVFFS